jgi:hypothetical protein
MPLPLALFPARRKRVKTMRKEPLAIVLILASLLLFSVAAQGDEPPCRDSVRAEAIGNTIQVHHDQAQWNCCAEIQFEFAQAQDTLNLLEIESFAVGPCLCLCCFDLMTSITDVAPGTYLVRVLAAETGELFGEVWVTVEIGQWNGPVLGEHSQSPCGGWPISVEPNSTWGRIKALYR